MNSAKRPIAVLFLSCLYIAVGTIGFAVNFPNLIALQRESMDRTYRVVSCYCRSLHVPWPELGTLAHARLDGLSRSDQFSGSSSGRHPLDHLRPDCLDSLSS